MLDMHVHWLRRAIWARMYQRIREGSHTVQLVVHADGEDTVVWAEADEPARAGVHGFGPDFTGGRVVEGVAGGAGECGFHGGEGKGETHRVVGGDVAYDWAWRASGPKAISNQRIRSRQNPNPSLSPTHPYPNKRKRNSTLTIRIYTRPWAADHLRYCRVERGGVDEREEGPDMFGEHSGWGGLR
jgi:hypothetical protein